MLPESPSPVLSQSPDPLAQPSSSSKEILDVLKGLETGFDNKFSTIVEKLDTVCDRLDILETRQKGLEEDIRASSSGASSSPRTPIPGKRMRRTPPALQVCVNV